jgi:hypothetical protein
MGASTTPSVMAIILKGITPCAICQGALDRAYLATSGVAFPESHPLYRFCDAPLHLDCLEEWPHRLQFSQGYFALFKQACQRGYATQLAIASDRSWSLGCGPCRRTCTLKDFDRNRLNDWPYYVQVVLQDWPIRLYSYWNEWEAFVAGEYSKGWEGGALLAAHQRMAVVRTIAPDLPSLERLLENYIQKSNSQQDS